MTTFPCWKKAYVIMGGGIKSKNKLHNHVIERCNLFLDIPQAEKESALVITSSCFSLNVRTKLRKNGTPESEASLIYLYLRDNGYKGEILCEQQSHDTIGSVYFVLNNYLKIFEISKVFFITSDFHKARVDIIARHFNNVLFNYYFDINVVFSKTKGSKELRSSREKKSCKIFKKGLGQIENPSALMFEFYKTHSNYNEKFCSSAILGDKFLY